MQRWPTRIASEAIRFSLLNIFLYLDAVHIVKAGQRPALFGNEGQQFLEMAERGVRVRAYARCAAARGYRGDQAGICPDYRPEIKITTFMIWLRC